MKEKEIELLGKILQGTVEQIKGLLAWEQLQRAERRPGQPPGFSLTDSIDEDLRNQYSRFLALAQQLHAVLDSSARSSVSITCRHLYRRQLLDLEQEIRSLGLGERFLKR